MNGSPVPGPVRDRSARAGRMEILISNVLRLGVATSLGLIVAGLVLSFAHHPEYRTSPPALGRLTQPGSAFAHNREAIVRGLLAARGEAVTAVGLLLLIATPVLRVAVSVLVFALGGDRTYTVITAIVLGLLLVAFALGAAG